MIFCACQFLDVRLLLGRFAYSDRNVVTTVRFRTAKDPVPIVGRVCQKNRVTRRGATTNTANQRDHGSGGPNAAG